MSPAKVAQQLIQAFHGLAYAEAHKVKWFGTADKGEIASICASDPGNYANLANLYSYEKMYKERSDAIRGSGLAPVITSAHALSYEGWNGLGKFAGGGAAIWILKADGRDIPPEIAYDFLEGTGAVAAITIAASTASIASETARPSSLPSPRSLLSAFRNIRSGVTKPCGNVAPATGGKVKHDLMGGPKTKLGEGWTNFDRLATEGIADDVANLGKHFKPGQLAEVVANNPQAEFLPHVGPLVEQGGTVTVRGNFSNGFFKKVWDGKASGLDGFEVVSKTENVANPGYLRTDGTPVGGQIHEIVLRKK